MAAKTVAEFKILMDAQVKGQQSTSKALNDLTKVVNTLSKSVTKMGDNINKSMNKVSKSTKGAARSFSAAGATIEGISIKQFKAIQQASRGFLNYEAAVKRSGVAVDAQKTLIQNAKLAFNDLNAQMRRSNLGIKGFTTTQERFRNSMRGSTSELRKQTSALKRQEAAASKSSKIFQSFSAKFDEFGRAVRIVEGPLGGTAARLQTLSAALKSVNFGTLAFVGGIVAVGAAIAVLSPLIVKATLEFERMRGGLQFATGSAKLAKEEFGFLKDTSLRLGLDLVKVGRQYTLLSAASAGTASEGINVRKVFETISKASIVLGLSADDQAGIFRALQQMMSKGTVQAEELRGQLGERLPGAFTLAAKSMGVTTQELGKMLKAGEVLAVDLIPKLINELDRLVSPQVEEAMNRLQSKINRAKTSFDLWLDALSRSTPVVKIFGGALDILTHMFDTLTKSMEGSENALRNIDANGFLNVTQDEIEKTTEKIKALEAFIAKREKQGSTGFAGGVKQRQEDIDTAKQLLMQAKMRLAFAKEDLALRTSLKKVAEDKVKFMEAAQGVQQKSLDTIIEFLEKENDSFKVAKDIAEANVLIADAQKLNARRLGISNEKLKKYIDGLLKVKKEFIESDPVWKAIQDAVEESRKSQDKFNTAVTKAEEKIRLLGNAVEETDMERKIASAASAFRLTLKNADKLKINQVEINRLVDEFIAKMTIVEENDAFEKKTEAALKLAAALEKANSKALVKRDEAVGKQIFDLESTGTSTDARTIFIEEKLQKVREEFRKTEQISVNTIGQMRAHQTKLQEALDRTRKEAEGAFDRELLQQALEDAKGPLDIYTERMGVLEDLLKKFPDHAEAIKKAMKATRDELIKNDPMLKKLADTWQGLADSISDSLTSGEDAMDSFKSVLREFVNSALKDLLRLAFGVPGSGNIFTGGGAGGGGILSGLGGGILKGIGGLFGGRYPSGSFSGGSSSIGLGTSLHGGAQFSLPTLLMAAKGKAWTGSGTRFLAGGGIINSPTAFSSNEGMNVAGEAGPEAVLPLTRGAGGSLGVNASGLGTVNIYQNLTIEAGVSQTVRTEMMRLLPHIKQETEAAVIDARRRDPNIFGPNAVG